MEKNKTYILLYMYSELKEGRVLIKDDIIDKFEINERTFYRYIKEIKEFILQESVESNGQLIGEELISDKEKDGYILNKLRKKVLNEKEILAISKVLLESRGFVKCEMEEIINSLLDNCVCEDKGKIKHIIGNEFIHYVSPHHGKQLLNKLWEISSAIKDQKIIEIGYCKLGIDGKVEKNIIKRLIRPQGLLFSEYYFYLIGFIEGKSYEYPTIFRVDRIENLRITDNNYEINYSNRFEDGEFRKYIQFMQTGDLERIKFRYTGSSIEAVLDKLPNAEIIKENSGEYIVKTKMFGKGIKMWLLSQGDSVEVLEPQLFRNEFRSKVNKMVDIYK
ncbi:MULTISPECIES: helix-turn-helix transcriptional regulator [Clostridium]|uniref:helix-turn-helix transcriptional regulator n=1 Tax=Clostridium TaxID=1485 RepID=UPI0005FBC0EE|nr:MULTISPECIES: WYL domain-containing protein [Clostridium]KJZ85589.1 hypothetical protein ClosIBUN125C_CONTIG5g00135 [Clostridium sp. IBUN125C]KJZ97847.1 hypothetical protein ClosIBUN13A_CONTIG104g01361 [Clostridium sp. IBUN13A]